MQCYTYLAICINVNRIYKRIVDIYHILCKHCTRELLVKATKCTGQDEAARYNSIGMKHWHHILTQWIPEYQFALNWNISSRDWRESGNPGIKKIFTYVRKLQVKRFTDTPHQIHRSSRQRLHTTHDGLIILLRGDFWTNLKDGSENSKVGDFVSHHQC